MFAGAFSNRKLREAFRFRRLDAHFRNYASLGWSRLYVLEKGLQRSFFSFDMDLHAFFRIQHPTLQTLRSGKPVHKRPEADTLHNTAHLYGVSVWHDFYFAFTTQPRPCQTLTP